MDLSEPALVLFAPVTAGALIGLALRSIRRTRLTGRGAFLLAFVLPMSLAIGVAAGWHSLALWDALQEGLLLGFGVVLTGHQAFVDRRAGVLAVSSLAAGLLLLEVAARAMLPGPPGLAVSQWRFLDQRRNGMGEQNICSVIYRTYAPGQAVDGLRPCEAVDQTSGRPRVLHIGDSMTYGYSLQRDQTFVARLGLLEPNREHVNAGISMTAPDDYFAILQAWLGCGRVNEVVMYIYAGNDLSGLDTRHGCAADQSLLVYENGVARLRFPEGPRAPSPAPTGSFDLRPPYFAALLARQSVAASFLVVEFQRLAVRAPTPVETDEVEREHLEVILRTVRDQLASRQIPFLVVVLPAVLDPAEAPPGHEDEILAVARKVGVPTFDPRPTLLAARRAGQDPFLPNHDIHYSAAGHALLGSWLHDHVLGTEPIR